MRIDKATDYLIKQARFAQRKWQLTDRAFKIVLRRLLAAEDCAAYEGRICEGTLSSGNAIQDETP